MVYAQLNQEDQQALDQTKRFLQNREARESYFRQNPGTQEVLNSINSLGMNAGQKDQVFKVSADVFEQLVNTAQGDSQNIKKILEGAQNDPEAFYKMLPENIKNQVKGLANELSPSDTRGPTSSPNGL